MARATIEQFPTQASDVEPSGDQLVVAGTIEGTASSSVVTRLSNDAGMTWGDLDEYEYVAGKRTRSGPMTTDTRGNVYAAIIGTDAGDANHWLVRRLACQP